MSFTLRGCWFVRPTPSVGIARALATAAKALDDDDASVVARCLTSWDKAFGRSSSTDGLSRHSPWCVLIVLRDGVVSPQTPQPIVTLQMRNSAWWSLLPETFQGYKFNSCRALAVHLSDGGFSLKPPALQLLSSQHSCVSVRRPQAQPQPSSAFFPAKDQQCRVCVRLETDSRCHMWVLLPACT